MDTVRSEKTIRLLVDFIKNSFQSSGSSHAVIGVSGGIDSATSLALTVKALGREHVFPMILPCGELGLEATRDALLVISSLSIPTDNVRVVDIQSMVNTVAGYDSSVDQSRRGNIMARVRMSILFDQAKKRNAMVVGTENKTEHHLGYYTRFGDEASDIEPLRGLYKTQVYELARELSIPSFVITKAPTAGLWVGQTDEGEFGFSYADADQILSHYIDQQLTGTDLEKKGLDKKVIQQVIARVEANKYKQKLPYLPSLE